jgi:hypothetical protein
MGAMAIGFGRMAGRRGGVLVFMMLGSCMLPGTCMYPEDVPGGESERAWVSRERSMGAIDMTGECSDDPPDEHDAVRFRRPLP